MQTQLTIAPDEFPEIYRRLGAFAIQGLWKALYNGRVPCFCPLTAVLIDQHVADSNDTDLDLQKLARATWGYSYAQGFVAGFDHPTWPDADEDGDTEYSAGFLAGQAAYAALNEARLIV